LFIAAGIFHPEAGGPATYLYELLPKLQARGWEVRVVTYSDDRPTATYPYPVQRVPRRVLPLRMLHYAYHARKAAQWADMVYFHTLDLPVPHRNIPRVVKIVGDPAWERAIRKGWIPAAEDIDDFQRKRYGSKVDWAQELRARQVRGMDGVVVPSEYLKRLVIGWGVDESRVRVIYNALPVGAFQETLVHTMPQRDARAQLNLPDAPTILTVARLTAWKGVDHLIAAVEQVPEVRLLVIGDGPMLPQLQAQAESLKGRVTFLGRLPHEAVPMYIQAADYLALYSGYEGLSHTLLESLLLRTPVIASDKGGNPEVVQHGVNGLLVPYVNREALVAALKEAFQPGKREALAANAHIGMERFDFGRMVEQTAAYVASFVRGK
jgi:glycosyltransferase involved in cell wall biosynthesis